MSKHRLAVFIHQGSDSKVGGPHSFLTNFQTYFSRKQITLANSLDEAKVLFISVSCPMALLCKAKRRRLKIVQRLDGLHYRSRNGRFWWWKNKKAWMIYRFFADHVVFQTHYAHQQVILLAGKPRSSFSVIPNATDEQVFHPEETPRQAQSTYRFLTSGSYRHIDMIRPLVQALDLFAQPRNFTLDVIGAIGDDAMRK